VLVVVMKLSDQAARAEYSFNEVFRHGLWKIDSKRLIC
jgi:hypothetical protein